jgi:predicted metalloendopeptidase
LDRADAYFKQAYSFASAGSQDTFQIDNHYAYFLLVKANEELEDTDVVKAMELFKHADSLILKQTLEEQRRHYPYKVAQAYEPFVSKYIKLMHGGHKKHILKSANTLFARIDQLPADRKLHDYVRKCQKVMSNIIKKLRS